MKFASIAVVAASLLITAPAAAQSPAATDKSSSAKIETAQSDNKVCRRLQVTGTRRTDKVCMSREDWKKVDEQVHV